MITLFILPFVNQYVNNAGKTALSTCKIYTPNHAIDQELYRLFASYRTSFKAESILSARSQKEQ